MKNFRRASAAASGFAFALRFGKAILKPGARVDETEDLKPMKLNATLFLGATLAAVPALAFALSLPAAADEPGAQGDPGVARISDLAGGVDVRRADANDSFTAALNAPVNPGDYVTTQDDSRAEVEFDYAALLRVGPDTQIRFTQLDPHQHTLQLAEGTVELRVLRGLDAHPEVDTPSATIRPEASGRYRITVTSDGNTEVTVREGRADVALGDGASSQALDPGSTLLVTGQGADVRSQTIAAVGNDDFDRWTDGRDARYARVDDWAYVDRGIVGADDLGQYGHWTDSSDYGQVWTPNDQPAGWAPYTDGRWVWEPYYGWTWVAAEPWGWAPYHYGRWFYAADAGWCWYPGAYSVADPYVYEPAVVGFFGYGGGIDINLGFGNIGWTALAPFEVFHPWWGRGFGRFGGGNTFVFNNFGNNFNTFGHGNITRMFRNAGAPGGVIGVSGSNFASGHFEHIQPVHGSQLGAITPVRGVLPILPTTHNLAMNPRFTEPVHTGPLSPRFEHLTPVRGTTPLFNEQRDSIATLAKQQFPNLAPSIDHQIGAERSAASPAQRFTEGGSHAAFAPGRQNSVWERFGGASSVPGTGSVARGAPPVHENNAFRESTPVHDATTERASGPGRDGVSPRANGEVWSRFGESGGGHSETFERRPAYAAPDRSSAMPERSTMTPERSPIIPRVQTFSQSGQSFSRSVEPYSPPSRAFSQPARSFSEPARSFSQPARSFSPPTRSFSAPARSYSAPARSYSAPARTYSAPAHTSSGNTRSADGRNHR